MRYDGNLNNVPRHVHRTVRDGQVTIYGAVYRPRAYYLERDGKLNDETRPYHDELEGMRLRFSLYAGLGYNDKLYIYEYQSTSIIDFTDIEINDETNWHWSWWYTEQEWQDHTNGLPHYVQFERNGVTTEPNRPPMNEDELRRIMEEHAA